MNLRRILFLGGIIGVGYFAYRWWANRAETVETGAIVADVQAKARSLIRMGEKAAVNKAKQLGLVPRLGMRDGVGQPLTQDFNPSRVTFQVTKGLVTGVKVG